MSKKGKIEFWRNTEKGHLEFYLCISFHRVLNAKSKKIEKNGHADRLISLAVKWAEMAADHENGQNSKISFSQNHGHYVVSWKPT